MSALLELMPGVGAAVVGQRARLAPREREPREAQRVGVERAQFPGDLEVDTGSGHCRIDLN
jgi:hypothetical protein